MRAFVRLLTLILLMWGGGEPTALAQSCSPGACGAEGNRACGIFERVPSCNPLLVERAGCCVHPACGRPGERACTVVERIPSCDGGLVERSGRCVMPTPCGGEGQRPCLVWEHVPSCETNLIESPIGVACVRPPCGREGQRACVVTERILACDVGLTNRNGTCGLPTPCGSEGQRACPVWERVPSCFPNLIESGGSCVHPACGHAGEAACTVNVRIPSCDTGLVERAGRCVNPPCGAEGGRPCTVLERLPSCDAGLVERPLGVSCVHPACGRLNERACTLTERIPSCDGDLVESGGTCTAASPCTLPEARVAPTPPADMQPGRLNLAFRVLPQGLTGTRVGDNTVRLRWTAVPGATSYVVSRNGQALATLAANSVSFDHPRLPAGSHEYQVQALPAPIKTVAAKVRMRIGSFNLVVLGDSVGWGQGLSDANKYSSQVARAVAARVGAPVNVVMAAHSGANILPPAGSSAADESRATPGELPNTFPTIIKQLDVAQARLAAGATVDLVLVIGCINDVGLGGILDPTLGGAQVANQTARLCNAPVVDLLQRAGARFPQARIVLSGYYPLVSQSSDLTAIGALLANVGVAAGAGAVALGIPSVNPVSGAVVGATITEVTHRLVAMNAQAFYVASTRALAASARTANERINGRVSFACAAFTPRHAYAAPDTALWLVPTGGATNDEVNQARNAQVCPRDDLLTLSGATPGSVGFEMKRLQCRVASMGHPNLLGARMYADAIQREIEPLMNYWGNGFAPVQRSR